MIVELVLQHGIFLFDSLEFLLLPLDKLQECVHLRRFALRVLDLQVGLAGALRGFEGGAGALVGRPLGLHEFFVEDGHALFVGLVLGFQLFLRLRARLVLVVVGECVDHELFGLVEGFLVAQLCDELIRNLLSKRDLRVHYHHLLLLLLDDWVLGCACCWWWRLQLCSHLRSGRGAILRAHVLIFKVTPLALRPPGDIRLLGLTGAAIFETPLKQLFKGSLAILAAFGQRGRDGRLIQIRLKESLQEVEVVRELFLRRNRSLVALGCRVGPSAGWLVQQQLRLDLCLGVSLLLLLDLDGRHSSLLRVY